MANSQGLSTAAKVRAVAAITTGNFKCALYFTSASISPATTDYTTSGEVTGTGYSAGGVACDFNAAASSGTTAFANLDGDISFGVVTLADFNCAMVYDSDTGKCVAIYTFGNTSVTGQPFGLDIPADGSSTAAVRIG